MLFGQWHEQRKTGKAVIVPQSWRFVRSLLLALMILAPMFLRSPQHPSPTPYYWASAGFAVILLVDWILMRRHNTRS
jgi:hypothetical protein